MLVARVGAGEMLDERDADADEEGVSVSVRVSPGTASAPGGEMDRMRMWPSGRRGVRCAEKAYCERSEA